MAVDLRPVWSAARIEHVLDVDARVRRPRVAHGQTQMTVGLYMEKNIYGTFIKKSTPLKVHYRNIQHTPAAFEIA